MSLIRTQAIVTVSIPGLNLGPAGARLGEARVPYADARIVTITQKTNWWKGFWGSTELLAVIEYTPAPTTD